MPGACTHADFRFAAQFSSARAGRCKDFAAWKRVADNLQTLQAAKVELIIGEYSGCGDEGNWESTSFEPAGAWEKLDEKLRNEVGELLESACGELESPGNEP